MAISPTSNRSLPAEDPNGIPITDLEGRFDAAGNLLELAHLRRMQWSWRGGLSQAVIIERPGGTDDAESYLYGTDDGRVRKLATRVIQGGQVEVTEKVYLGGCERKRVLRGGQVVLERWTSHFEDGRDRIALLHRWNRDDLAVETDDPSRPRFRYQLCTDQGSSMLELDEDAGVLSY